MPALNKAREKANAVQCIGNLKQYTLLFSQYSMDYKEWMMNAGDRTGEARSVELGGRCCSRPLRMSRLWLTGQRPAREPGAVVG